MSKSLGSGELNRAIETLRATKTTRSVHRSVRIRTALASLLLSCTRLIPSRIEEEVVVAVVKRTIFYDVSLMPVHASDTESQVLNDFIFKTSGVFTDAGRLKTRIDGGGRRAEVNRREARCDGGRRWSIQRIDIEVLVRLAIASRR